MEKRQFFKSIQAVALFLLATTMSVGLTACSDSDTENADNDSNPVACPAYTTLKEALQTIDHISMIVEDPDTLVKENKAKGELDYKEQYSMFYRQDLNHEVKDGDTFQQKVCILFRGFDRPTILVTEGYLWRRFGDAGDLGINLNANMVHVEHRNFGESYNQDQGQWKYETSAQVSADIHAIYQALKPIFKGKWMCAGTSKSGTTSINYAYHYPKDMDLAVAFCAPFVTSLYDEGFGHYLFNEVSTEQNRELMKTAIRKALTGGETGNIYKAVCQDIESQQAKAPVFTEYVYNVFDTFFQVFQYYLSNQHTEVLQYMATNSEMLAQSISANILGNRDDIFHTYYVDCAKDFGWVNPGYEYFADLLDGTSFDRNDVLPIFLKPKGDQWLVNSYDNSVNTDIMDNFFRTTTCPVLLYYSQDDPWSGGQPRNQLSSSVKKIINPIGVHSPLINDPNYCPAEIKKEVMDFVNTYMQ